MKIPGCPHESVSGIYYEGPVTECSLITHWGQVYCRTASGLKPHRQFCFEFLYLASGEMDGKVVGRTFAQGGGDLFVPILR